MALGVKKLFQHLDAQLHEIRNAVLHKVAGNPGSPVEGQYWWDDTANRVKYQDNAGVKTVAHTGELASGSVTAVTATAPITSTEGTAPVIAITAANGSNPGSQSAAHYTLVNGATAAATGSALMQRDANGRSKVVDASADDDIPGWGQVKAWAAGARDPKDSVRVVSTVNVAIATGLENGDTVDGVVVATGNRVLLAGQTDPIENGIYTVVASGAASRALDADSSAEVTGGMYMVVNEGTKADHVYQLTTNDPIVLGTTSLTFGDMGSTLVQAGAGLTKTADTIDVVDGYGIDVSANEVTIDKALVTIEKTGLIGGAGPSTQYTINNPGFVANAIHSVQIQDVSTGEFEDMVGIQIESDGDVLVDFGIVSVAGTAYRYIMHGLAA